MIILLLALLIGAVAGLRTFTAPTAVSWAAHLGWLSLGGGPLAFLGVAWTPWILTLLALAELVIDQLPPPRAVRRPAGSALASCRAHSPGQQSVRLSAG